MVSVFAITGEIKSCSGWRLNHLPEVKQFLKISGHADAYEGLVVNWVPGHTPTLFINSDAGEEIDRIDLSQYTTDQLHDLVKSKGFALKAVESVPLVETLKDEM